MNFSESKKRTHLAMKLICVWVRSTYISGYLDELFIRNWSEWIVHGHSICLKIEKILSKTTLKSKNHSKRNESFSLNAHAAIFRLIYSNKIFKNQIWWNILERTMEFKVTSLYVFNNKFNVYTNDKYGKRECVRVCCQVHGFWNQ